MLTAKFNFGHKGLTDQRPWSALKGRGRFRGWNKLGRSELDVSCFATGVLKDRAAVRAAIIQPWSNGQVEAQITKLKLVKRQVHGRAKIDLLEARLLGTA